jgi:hypothetical protein
MRCRLRRRTARRAGIDDDGYEDRSQSYQRLVRIERDSNPEDRRLEI